MSFVWGPDGDGHLFGTYPAMVEIRENPEFHGRLPLLSGVSGGSPWAGSAEEVARNLLYVAHASHVFLD